MFIVQKLENPFGSPRTDENDWGDRQYPKFLQSLRPDMGSGFRARTYTYKVSEALQFETFDEASLAANHVGEWIVPDANSNPDLKHQIFDAWVIEV